MNSFALRSFANGRLTLAVQTQDPGLASFALGSAGRIGELVRQVTSQPIEIEILRDEPARPNASRSRLLDEVRKIPIVQEAAGIFNATVIDVQEAAGASTFDRASSENGDNS